MTIEQEAEQLKKLVGEINETVRNLAKRKITVSYKLQERGLEHGCLSPGFPYTHLQVKITKDL
jgi:hypothetical protein